jgi:hypothetical protein
LLALFNGGHITLKPQRQIATDPHADFNSHQVGAQ